MRLTRQQSTYQVSSGWISHSSGQTHTHTLKIKTTETNPETNPETLSWLSEAWLKFPIIGNFRECTVDQQPSRMPTADSSSEVYKCNKQAMILIRYLENKALSISRNGEKDRKWTILWIFALQFLAKVENSNSLPLTTTEYLTVAASSACDANTRPIAHSNVVIDRLRLHFPSFS